jgi:ADP-heptose:LPS heptosyltransferase
MEYSNLLPEQHMRSVMLPLKHKGKMAFIMSPRLGDALIAMTLIYNLHRQGYDVTVYSDFIADLKEWFPWARVFAYSAEQDAKATWGGYDILLHRYPHDVRCGSELWHPCVLALSALSLYRQCRNEVDQQLEVCKKIFDIQQPYRDNGIVLPNGLRSQRASHKVAIHPTASLKTRYWLAKHFISLAKRLESEGYEPMFLVAPHEKEDTEWIVKAGFKRIITTSIENAAEVICGSGWFIGNDSGLGHLASCLGIPTVSMHQRRKVKICWHPGFALNKALLPRVNLLVKSWKEKYWKYFLTPSQVYNAFVTLTKTKGEKDEQ